MDYIMTVASAMKAVGIEKEATKVKLFKKLKVVRKQDIDIIVDVVYMEE